MDDIKFMESEQGWNISLEHIRDSDIGGEENFR